MQSVQIGPVTLSDFEVPASISFGGDQRIAVHQLYGGDRVTECLGADPDEIRFDGVFTGPNAADRVRLIQELRISGATVWLGWGTFRYLVVVRRARFEYQKPWWIPFEIRCTVITGEVASLLNPPVAAQAVVSILANAIPAADLCGINLSPLQSVIANPQVYVGGSSAQRAALTAVSATMAQLQQLTAAQSVAISAALPAGSAPALAASNFANRVVAAQTLCGSAACTSYVGRVGVILGD